jgi:cytochrome c oxidase subunit IV
MAHAEGQTHPISVYLKIWALLFVLSTMSYLVDYFQFESYLRWFLIVLFMLLKAGLIVAVFMHMMWERMALMCAIILPPVLVIVFMFLMVSEGGYTLITRGTYFAVGGGS